MLYNRYYTKAEYFYFYNQNFKNCKPLIDYKLNLYYIGEKYHLIKEKNLALLILDNNIGIYNIYDYQNEPFSLKLYYNDIKICQINSGFFAILKRETLIFLEIEYDYENKPIKISIPKIINLVNFSKNYDHYYYNYFDYYYNDNDIEYIGKNHLIYLDLININENLLLFSFEKKDNSLIIKSEYLQKLFGIEKKYITQIFSDKDNNQLALVINDKYYNNFYYVEKKSLYFYDMNELDDKGKNCKIKKVLKMKWSYLLLQIFNKDYYFCHNKYELYLISSKYLEIISIYKNYPFTSWDFILIFNSTKTKMIFFYNIYRKKSLHIYEFTNNKKFKLLFNCRHKRKVIDKKIIISKKKHIKLYKQDDKFIYTNNNAKDIEDSDDNSEYYSEDYNLDYSIKNYAQKITAKKNKKHLKELGAKKLNKKQKKGSKKIRVNIKKTGIDIFNY